MRSILGAVREAKIEISQSSAGRQRPSSLLTGCGPILRRVHPGPLLLAILLALPVYGFIVFVAATKPQPVLAQLPYVLGISLLFAFTKHEEDYGIFGLALGAYCAVTWLLISSLRRFER